LTIVRAKRTPHPKSSRRLPVNPSHRKRLDNDFSKKYPDTSAGYTATSEWLKLNGGSIYENELVSSDSARKSVE
jgi:hypothetical protein